MTKRARTHLRGVRRVAAELAAQGIGSEIRQRRAGACCDLLVSGIHHVMVRVARRRSLMRTVIAGGQRYEYVYPSFNWSLHAHGKLMRAADTPGFWALVAIGGPTLIVPRAELARTYVASLRLPVRRQRLARWAWRYDLLRPDRHRAVA